MSNQRRSSSSSSSSSSVFSLDTTQPPDIVQPRDRGMVSSHPCSIPVTEPLESVKNTMYNPVNSVSQNVSAIQRSLGSISDTFFVRCVGILMNANKGIKFEVDTSFENSNCSVAFFNLPKGLSLNYIHDLLPDELLSFSFGLKVDSAYLAELSSRYDGFSFLQFDPESGALGLIINLEGPTLQLRAGTTLSYPIILILPFLSGELDIPIAVEDD